MVSPTLKFFKRSDGTLVVGEQVLHPETLPDGRVVYNYIIPDEAMHFVVDDAHSNYEGN